MLPESNSLIIPAEILLERGGARSGYVVARNGQYQDEKPVCPHSNHHLVLIQSCNQQTRHEPGSDETQTVPKSSGNLDITELEGSQRKPHSTRQKE